MAGDDANPGVGNATTTKFDDLLSLVLARSRGEVGEDAVENALSSIVASHAPPPSSGKTNATSTAAKPIQQIIKDAIIPDEGNYDDGSEDENTLAAAKKLGAPQKAKAITTKKRGRPRKSGICPVRQEAVENIPLGKMGERMLITFGDGPTPAIDVISSTLLGTRASLQRAILDARALRRQQKDKWHQARATALMHRASSSNDEIKKTSTKHHTSGEDIELSFKAMDGFGDNLRLDVPCGFDVSQLEMLFPEEMSAYQRWKKMHDAYSENSKEMPTKSDVDGNESEENEEADSLARGGRLVERLANFDARTNRMRGDWYMEFSDVRRGSFLPRAGRKKQKAGDTEDQSTQKGRGRPSKSRPSWHTLNPTSVIFLHWVGFDPRSALSPPNEETTHALAFLSYDFFGKLVEKAVALRLKQKSTNRNHSQPLLELSGGDQLEKKNIDRAIVEVDLKSLYSSSNIDLGKSAKITQLYFGPGFEDRLELEMDEIFGQKEKTLTEQEMKTRKEEETLFSALPNLPTKSNAQDLIEDSKGSAAKVSTSSAKKSRTE